MVWDPAVANSAQQWANEICNENGLRHSTNNMYGENLAKGHPSMDAAIQDW